MKTTVIKYAGYVLLSVAVLLSCRKDPGGGQPPEAEKKIESMHQLKASDDFSWKTMQDIEVDLYISNTSFIMIKSADGVIYHKGMAKGGHHYITKVTLPGYEKEVYVFASGQSRLIPIQSMMLTGNF